MRIEVDMSGKIEDLRQDTIIAFSNNEQFSVLLLKKTKQELFQEFRSKFRQLRFRIFAICLYCCVEGYIKNKNVINIDVEYDGKDAEIKTYLLPLIRKKYGNFDKNIIRFSRIGKKSKAHEIAILTNRKVLRPNRIITKQNIIEKLRGDSG